MRTLAGKTALVTGGSGGIGRAVSLRLAIEGASVAVHFAEDRDAAEATRSLIRARGGRATTIQAKFGDREPETVARHLWEAFDHHHEGLDILVNAAGAVHSRKPIGELTSGDLDEALVVNSVTPLIVTQQALHRIRDGGSIVNVSAHLTRGAYQPDLVAYAISKAAVDVWTPTLATQLGARGIRVNSVAPGVVDTDMNTEWLGHSREMVAGLSPLGRIAEPDDVADVIAFLAGPDARWVTGERIDVSGGSLL
ncbi:SDR family oxidoreductase [Brachybacterium sp. FME24]|uniref:SDR family oxidoreductase n=1 Tax=Brachybacterium sp. FME24 TaxID=2742605 RepID=UPI00186736FB|nr:SDR family oxidoreductase [Brachybacterium sp. FME24]